jgi:hypothetical protein
MQDLSNIPQESIPAVAVRHQNDLFSTPEENASPYSNPAWMTENDLFDLSSNDTASSITDFEYQDMHSYRRDLLDLCQPGSPRPKKVLSLFIKLIDYDREILKLAADDFVMVSLWCIQKYRWNQSILTHALDMLKMVYPGSSTENMMAVLLTKIVLATMNLQKGDVDIQDIGMKLIHYTVVGYGNMEDTFLAFCEEGGVETLLSAWSEFRFQEAANALNIIRGVAVINRKRFESDKTEFTDPLYIHTRLVLLRLPNDFK